MSCGKSSIKYLVNGCPWNEIGKVQSTYPRRSKKSSSSSQPRAPTSKLLCTGWLFLVSISMRIYTRITFNRSELMRTMVDMRWNDELMCGYILGGEYWKYAISMSMRWSRFSVSPILGSRQPALLPHLRRTLHRPRCMIFTMRYYQPLHFPALRSKVPDSAWCRHRRSPCQNLDILAMSMHLNSWTDTPEIKNLKVQSTYTGESKNCNVRNDKSSFILFALRAGKSSKPHPSTQTRREPIPFLSFYNLLFGSLFLKRVALSGYGSTVISFNGLSSLAL